jgi:hypothetical protein
MAKRGWPRPGAHGRARPSAVSLFVGLSTRGLAAVRTRRRSFCKSQSLLNRDREHHLGANLDLAGFD